MAFAWRVRVAGRCGPARGRLFWRGVAAVGVVPAAAKGVLFPWNAIITAVDYFSLLYPGRNVESRFSVAYMVPNFVLLMACTLLAEAPTSHVRVVMGFGTFLVVMAALPAVAALGGGFGAVTLLVCATGVGDGLSQGAVYALAGPMPPRFTQALTGGTSVAGLAVSTLRLVTKAAFDDTQVGLRNSALLYFALAGAWVAACIALYGRLVTLPVVVYYRRRAAAGGVDAQLASYENRVAENGARSSEDVHVPSVNGRARAGSESGEQLLAGGESGESSAPVGWPKIGTGASGRDGGGWFGALTARARGRAVEFAAAWRIAWPEALSIWFCYTLTLSIFPAFFAVSGIESKGLGDWYAVVCIALWNFGDLTAKIALGAERCHITSRRTGLVLSGARVTFWPLFAIAARAGAGEGAVLTLSLLLGLSNGYVGGGVMMMAPQRAPPHLKEAVGNLAVLSLVFGLMVGGWLSFLWGA